MNDITLIGTVPKRITYHFTEAGHDLVRFTLRTSIARSAAAENENSAGATFVDHHCQAWGPAALDIHTHLKPGDRILVRGELHYRNHRNRRGEVQRFAEVHVRGYTYLGAEAGLTVKLKTYSSTIPPVSLVSE